MAVAGTPVSAASSSSVTTFTVNNGSGAWGEDEPAPAAGDLVLLHVLAPARLTGPPPGWMALDDGRSFWKILGPRDETLVTFCAWESAKWVINGWLARAGTYELPGNTGAGTSVNPPEEWAP